MAKAVDRSLTKYQQKRDFTKTPEPSGRTRTAAPPKARKEKELFFCVQKHLASHLHYDFRLEHRGVLLSWAVPKGPSLNPKDKRLAMAVEDHPLDYGDFEGVIPSGYGAGIVMLWDQGTWMPESQTPDIDAALEKGELKFTLNGVKLHGSFVLVRTQGRFSKGGSGDASRSWLLIKHRDAHAGEIDITQAAPDSVKSFLDFPHILAQNNPDIWHSDQPAKGGEAGKMLKQLIAEAAAIKAGKEEKQPAPKARRKAPAKPTAKKLK